METDESKQETTFDTNLLFQYFAESSDKLTSTAGKDIALFIGITGSGKSTTINYLLGHKFRKQKSPLDGGIAVPLEPNSIPAEIGNSRSRSQTIIPEAFPAGFSGISYCDCPGFEDTNGPEARVIASINTELAINSANSVCSVVVVLDGKNSFSAGATRSAAFRKVAKTLITLFKDADTLASSVVFLVTKVEKVQKAEFVSVLERFQQDIDLTKKGALESDESLEVRKAMLFIITTMISNQERIIMLNPFDNGETKQLLRENLLALQKRNQLTKADFRFSMYDSARRQFREGLVGLVGSSLSNIKNYEENIAKEKLIKENLALKKNEKMRIEKSLQKANACSDSTKLLANKNKEMQSQIDSLRLQKKALVTQQAEIEKNLKKISSEVRQSQEKMNNEFTRWHNDFSEHVPWYRCLGWAEHTFRYQGQPFDRISKSLGNGDFRNEHNEPSSGFYKVDYVGKTGHDGSAQVTLYAKNSTDSAYMVTHHKIKKAEAALMTESSNLMREIEEIADEIEQVNYAKINLNAQAKFTALTSQSECKRLKEKLSSIDKKIEKLEIDLSKYQASSSEFYSSIVARLPVFSAYIKFFRTVSPFDGNDPLIALTHELITKLEQLGLLNKNTSNSSLRAQRETLQRRFKIDPADNSRQACEKLFRCAAASGEFEIIQDCYEKDKHIIDSHDVNPKIWRTALHWACDKKDAKIVSYLLQKGACFEKEDAQGKLAWEYVLDTPELLILFQQAAPRLFQKYNISTSPASMPWGTLLRRAVATNDCIADVRYCCEVLKLDVNRPDDNPESRRSSLHWAVIKNQPTVTQYLLSRGADATLPDAKGETAVTYAQKEANNDELLGVLSIVPHGERSYRPK